MIRKGVHEARAQSAILSETKSGKEYVSLEFRTREGERVSWSGFFGDSVGKDNLTTTARTSAALRLCGWDGSWDDFTTATRNDVDISVSEDDYNGGMKVNFINRLGEGGYKPKPMADDKAKSFAARMKSRASSPTRTRNEHPNAPDNDDEGGGDLPF